MPGIPLISPQAFNLHHNPAGRMAWVIWFFTFDSCHLAFPHGKCPRCVPALTLSAGFLLLRNAPRFALIFLTFNFLATPERCGEMADAPD